MLCPAAFLLLSLSLIAVVCEPKSLDKYYSEAEECMNSCNSLESFENQTICRKDCERNSDESTQSNTSHNLEEIDLSWPMFIKALIDRIMTSNVDLRPKFTKIIILREPARSRFGLSWISAYQLSILLMLASLAMIMFILIKMIIKTCNRHEQGNCRRHGIMVDANEHDLKAQSPPPAYPADCDFQTIKENNSQDEKKVEIP
ncbi:hypothetical protein ACOME3_001284 [Neoechinorhynchus agilis]